MNFKQPLEIYVVWHPLFTEGVTHANSIYSTFCRNIDNPFEPSIGIPVYYRYERDITGKPIPIPIEESNKKVIVILVDDEMITDSNFNLYIEELVSQVSILKNEIILIPIAFTKNFSQLNNGLNSYNFVRTCDNELIFSLNQTKEGFIKSSLLHEVAKFIRVESITTSSNISNQLDLPPIRLFISHSKHDKVKYDALEFKKFVDSSTQLKTFFDVHDIGYGSDFEHELKKGISMSALIVFQSDSYASRPWCRIEVITAKNYDCSVIVVNAIAKGEKRSFPYLGNVPTIRLNNNFQEIIDLALEKIILDYYQTELMGQIANIFNVVDVNYVMSSMPELLDIIKIKKAIKKNNLPFAIILHPDPPLGFEELELLNEMDNSLYFVTPNQLPTLKITKYATEQ